MCGKEADIHIRLERLMCIYEAYCCGSRALKRLVGATWMPQEVKKPCLAMLNPYNNDPNYKYERTEVDS